jgi:hypothetical protein
MAKTDKLVGGNKVDVERVQWHVEVEGITLNGSSPDAVSAAHDATAAREAIQNALVP